MPIFEYQCADCRTSFEELVMGAARKDPDCPDCSSDNVKKLHSTFAAQSSGASAAGSFSESDAPMCGTCNGPGPCAVN